MQSSLVIIHLIIILYHSLIQSYGPALHHLLSFHPHQLPSAHGLDGGEDLR